MDAPHASSANQVVFEDEASAAAISKPKFDGVLSDFVYSSCYCEENVYMLCKKLSEVGVAAPDASDLFVVFISNPNRQVLKVIILGSTSRNYHLCLRVIHREIPDDIRGPASLHLKKLLYTEQIPIWRQRSSKDVEGLCIWDYHVICIQRKENGVQVWDLDTTLPCPASLDEYVAGAFQPWVSLKPEFSRLYRVIAAPLYLRFFASDRRHMKRADGSWMALPPFYDCLVAEDGAVHNLEEFITMAVEHITRNLREAGSLLLFQKFGVLLDEQGLLQFFKHSASVRTLTM